MAIQVVILAAGVGKRMHSDLPKILHTLGGKALLAHVIDTAQTLPEAKAPMVVVGHQGKMIQSYFEKKSIQFVEQKEQLGTGHAVQQALPFVSEQDRVLILCGDVPLISTHTLNHLVTSTPKESVGLITMTLPDPAGYGRIIRDNANRLIGIVEEIDATAKERAIKEMNTGIFLVPASYLKRWLPQLSNQNAQKEYYLTDIVRHALNEKIAIHTIQPEMAEEILGVNDRCQLAHLERTYQRMQAEKLMRQGVMLIDPTRFDVRGVVKAGRDVCIDVNVILEGEISIGDGCTIGPNCILKNVTLKNGVQVYANSVIEEATIGDECRIGPFARIRPGTDLAAQVHIGNFVEIKKSQIAEGSKVNHLTYIGDSEIGKKVNVGAGTITCNYDGVNKHKTIIEDGAFIGSNTSLVAPVTIHHGATIGAGSTITEDAPADKLTLARARQITVKHWEK